MENKTYELVVSNNMKYVAGICIKNKVNGRYEMKVWNGKNMRTLSTLFVYYDFGGKRFAISDDGKYVATAKYEDYIEGKLYIYEVETGKIVFENESLKRIQWIMFNKKENLMVGTESNGIFVFDYFSEICIKRIKGEEYFGENILALSSSKIKYKERVFKSSTFAYLFGTETSRGILLSEVNGHLYYYNDNGQLCWRTNCLEMGHFIIMQYDKRKNIVFGILFNPRKKGDERMHLAVLDEISGEIVCVYPIENSNYVFVKDNEDIMIANGQGSVYTFKNNQLEKRVLIYDSE